LSFSGGPEIELGMVLRNCVSQFRANEIELVVAYDPEALFDVDVVVDIPHYGLRLRFDPLSQRLRLVDVYDLLAVTLGHQMPFSGSLVLPSFRLVTSIIGP
jgi:hypothetical protein